MSQSAGMPHAVTAATAPGDLALALSGGGARAAYQVGVLRFLARLRPRLRIPVMTGASAGAINAVQLASFRGTFAEAVEELRRIWLSIETSKVYRVDAASLTSSMVRWGSSLVLGRARPGPRPRSLVDTAPLQAFLATAFRARDGRIEGIARNLADRTLRALAITTTEYATGRSVTWVQGGPVELWRRPQRAGVGCEIRLEHVMASTAIPLLFPAIRLDGNWHGDGSIRQIAPLSPALHMGATRIITVSTRARLDPAVVSGAASQEYPPPAQLLGVLLNAAFLDTLDVDVLNLNRISSLIEDLGEDGVHGLRKARALVVRPSCDLGELAAEYAGRLPRGLRYLLRGLGGEERSSMDFLSVILFEPAFIQRLLDLGESDGEEHASALEAVSSD